METIRSIEYDSEKQLLYVESGNFTGISKGVDEYLYNEIQRYYQDITIGSTIWKKEHTLRELNNLRMIHHLTPQSLGLLDIALWDLFGKIQQLPVYKILGGFRDRIPAYTESNGDFDLISSEINMAQKSGFIGHQISFSNTKIFTEQLREIDKYERQSLLLLATGRNSLNLSDSLHLGKKLQSAGFHWFQNPLSGNDTQALKKLNMSLTLPVIESKFATSSPSSAMKALTDRVVDRLSFEIPTMGGITDAIKWARGSEALGMNCEINWTDAIGPNAAIHILGAIRNAELISWRPNNSNFKVSKGHVIISSTPGLGFESIEKIKKL